MKSCDCALNFDKLPGKVDVAERGKRNNHGFWESNNLVCCDVKDDVDITVIFDENEIRISLGAHHIENKKTERAFHAVVDCNLQWDQAKRLRDFLSLLLAWSSWQIRERNESPEWQIPAPNVANSEIRE